MQVLRSWESVQLAGVILTIGNFDGVHRGHQAILAAGRRRADAASCPLVAMTFDPHPLAVLTPDHVPPMLTPTDEKLRLFQQAGVDIAVLVTATPDFLQMAPATFMERVIVARFAPRAIVEGASFRFGHGRQGDVATLRQAAGRGGFEVEVVEPVRIALGGHPDAVISSSLIRQLLANGTVDQAALCLGRPYALIGCVAHGAGRGHSLGFPTANVQVTGQLTPAEGVYAGVGVLEAGRFAAAVSIGRNATFREQELAVEAHLLGFEGDLYDRPIRLELLDWIRPHRQFAAPEKLGCQIRADLDAVRQAVADREPDPPSVTPG